MAKRKKAKPNQEQSTGNATWIIKPDAGIIQKDTVTQQGVTKHVKRKKDQLIQLDTIAAQK